MDARGNPADPLTHTLAAGEGVPPCVLPEGITLRPADDNDLELLYELYAGSWQREMAWLVAWSAAEKEAFLRAQFQDRRAHHAVHYPEARFDVVCESGVPVGRLSVAPMEREVRLMDIALLPQWRGRGIGAALIRSVMGEACSSGRYASLHVEPDNPARRLYARLGFVDVEQVGAQVRMHWRASASAAASDRVVSPGSPRR